MGCLRTAGFSFEMAVHAYLVEIAWGLDLILDGLHRLRRPACTDSPNM
jgi:hypothetical protein